MAQQHSDLHHLPPSSAPTPSHQQPHPSSSLALASSNTNIAPIPTSSAQPIASAPAQIDPFTMLTPTPAPAAHTPASAPPGTGATPISVVHTTTQPVAPGVKEMSKGEILALQKQWRMEKRRELEARNKKKQARQALNDNHGQPTNIASYNNNNHSNSNNSNSAPVAVPPMKRFKATFLAPETATATANNTAVEPGYQHYEYVGAHTISQPPPSPNNNNNNNTVAPPPPPPAPTVTANIPPAPTPAPVITSETIEAQRVWKEQKRREMELRRSKQQQNQSAENNNNQNNTQHPTVAAATGTGTTVSKRGRQPRKRTSVELNVNVENNTTTNANNNMNANHNTSNNNSNSAGLINVQQTDIVTSMGVPQQQDQIHGAHNAHHDPDVTQGLPTTVIQPAENEQVAHHLPEHDDGTTLEPLNANVAENTEQHLAVVASEAMLAGVSMALPTHTTVNVNVGESAAHQHLVAMGRHPLDHTNPLAQYTSFDDKQKVGASNNVNITTSVAGATHNANSTYANDGTDATFQMVEGGDDIIGAAGVAWSNLGNINHN